MSYYMSETYREYYETILEHEEQGCNPQEVASFVNLTVDKVNLIKEYYEQA